ncbi:MAG: protein-glutamate O-methyltransferase CheR [Herpetosiphonaceae bacterium]|nr:protein-glutamate O-methyltransferase CheR [Herpetosiphonaceae bacterium]
MISTVATRQPVLLPPNLRVAYLELIKEWVGLELSEHQSRGLDEAIIQGMTQMGYTEPEAWYQTLASGSDRECLERLATRLTIGETHFFRVAPQIEALRMTVLPELIKQRTSTRQLHIWSAGCSTGEEAYTLALLIREQLPVPNQWDIRLLATDLNHAALDIARAGLYGEWSFRETPERVRQHYFVREGTQWRLLPTIRTMVDFRSMNLVAGSFPVALTAEAQHDLIVCRNVTIYFNTQATQRLYARFTAMLAVGGWLVLGPSDPPPQSGLLQAVNLPGAIVWRRAAQHPVAADYSEPQTSSNHAFIRATRTVQQAIRREAASPSLVAPLPECDQLLTPVAGAGGMARKQAEQGVHDRPLEVEGHLLLGMLHLDEGAVELAIESLRRATFLDEYSILAHFGLGRAYALAGYEVRARATLTHARRLLVSFTEKQAAEDGMPAVNELRHAIEMQLASLEGRGTPR